MEPTLEDYRKALEIVQNYRVCGNDGYGCGQLFKVEDMNKTIQYGNEYHWCKECYDVIRNEW